MTAMSAKLWLLVPEIIMFLGVVVVAVLGLAPRRSWRDAVPWVTCIFLVLAAAITPLIYTPELIQTADMPMPMLGKIAKIGVAIIGIILVMVSVGTIDRKLERAIETGRATFDPIRVNRGEFYAFLLLSLIGVNLCTTATDMIWLFLALELTSLPTYIMVAMSRPMRGAQEAAVKYFFLGALATAVFLFGFALLYGSTGTMELTEMRAAFAEQKAADGINLFGIVGMILAVLGLGYKIAAAPMHFYAADVYEGAASPVTAFLAFVPKTAGFLAIIVLLSTMGWAGHLPGAEPAEVTGLPLPVTAVLWTIAVLTMTLGNVGALLQNSVKRILAYSSIAHSGYMLIGVIAGPTLVAGAFDGLSAVLFYLFAYGIMNTAAFAVLAGLERNENEIESVDDLAGLRIRHPVMAVVMAVASASLLGVPPLVGFVGKLGLFMAGINAGHIPLVIIAGLNTAISAWYYLRLIALPILAKPSAQAETVVPSPAIWPRVAGIVTALGVLFVPIGAERVLSAAGTATVRQETMQQSLDSNQDHMQQKDMASTNEGPAVP